MFPFTLSLASKLLKNNDPSAVSAQTPDDQLNNIFSGGKESYANAAADSVTGSSDSNGAIDTMLGWVKSPKSSSADAISNAASQAANSEASKKANSNKLPSWVSDAATVYSRLAEQNAAKRADLRSEYRDSSNQALQTLNAIPGISDLRARNEARTRGLSAMAGR